MCVFFPAPGFLSPLLQQCHQRLSLFLPILVIHFFFRNFPPDLRLSCKLVCNIGMVLLPTTLATFLQRQSPLSWTKTSKPARASFSRWFPSSQLFLSHPEIAHKPFRLESHSLFAQTRSFCKERTHKHHRDFLFPNAFLPDASFARKDLFREVCEFF